MTPPKVLSATPETNAITVKWEAVAGIDSYRVYRTTDNSWVKISDVKASETSFIDTTVNSGTQYKYTVTSVKNNSESYIAEGNFKSANGTYKGKYINRIKRSNVPKTYILCHIYIFLCQHLNTCSYMDKY